MSDLRVLMARVRSFLRRDLAGRLEEEMESHADLLADDYVAGGMTQTEARLAAGRELGNRTLLRQEYREQSGLPLLENCWLDLRYSCRTLRRNPMFTVACIATLTMGLGAMITVLGVILTMFWKPLPYPNAGRLVVLNESDPRGGHWPLSEPMLLDVQARASSLNAIAGYRTARLALTGAGDPEVVESAWVTPSFFGMFGIANPAVSDVVISRSLWQRKWQMAPNAIGRAIVLDGKQYTICAIGDAPRDLVPGVDVLLSLQAKASESRSAHDVETVARMRAGVSPGQAQAELSAIATALAREHSQTSAGWGLQLLPLASYVVGPRVSRMIWMVSAAVALLWLLACANVAGLQMARSVKRRHEIGTRLSLGGSRGRILAQALIESLVLAFFGGILGLVVAELAMAAIRQFATSLSFRLADVEMNGETAMIALGCMLVSTVFSGLLSGRAPTNLGERGVSQRDYGRDALIVAQVSLASVLLLGATLLFQSFLRLEAVDPGFDADKIVTARFNHLDEQQVRHVTEQLTRLPEVAAVGATNVTPFSGFGTANRFRLESEAAGSEFQSASWRAVTPAFFSTLGIPLKSGRLFTNADRDGSLEVVIISERMARQFWPNQNPIGKHLLWGRSGSPKTIVGIVGDLRDLAVDAQPVPTMFRPFAQLSDAAMTLVIRTRQEPIAVMSSIRRQIRDIDQNAALQLQPLREAMSESILRPRALMMAVGAFATVSLLTAAVGLYGLIGYRVNQRQQEIGIRLALGASGGSIRWDVQKRCLRLVCLGMGIGLPLAYGLSSLMKNLLYETDATGVTAYVAVLVVFVSVALAASFGPAHRAARLDPASAIRHE